MSTDKRIAVVAAVLSDTYNRKHYSTADMAREIIRALDQRAQVTKWEGKRDAFLYEVEGCWVPVDDILAHLNTLPGAPLTMTDLKARMNNMTPQSDYVTKFKHGDPETQADCLRVYMREKRAGTDIRAILDAIGEEVVGPFLEQQQRASEAARHAEWMERVTSGRDCGWTYTLDPKAPKDPYMRHAGQLYRLSWLAPRQYKLLRVKAVGDQGEPTEPSIFRNVSEARDAIRAGKIKKAHRQK